MLKQLRIQNIILIENAEIDFYKGLNVLSGETGSGKSAIMHALGLIAGDRADAGMIRNGCEKGIVEAVFEIDAIPNVHVLLENSGISHENGDELLVRRELTANGKSRAFINNQQVQLGIIREIGKLLVDIVGQHANQRLFSIDSHREIVDLFGELESSVVAVSAGWSLEQSQRKKLDELLQNESQRLRSIEICQMEIAELKEARLKDNEETDLFAEYTLLANAEELSGKVGEICQSFTGERQGLLPILNRNKHSLQNLMRIDPSFEEIAKSYESAILEIQEVSHTLSTYLSRIEYNPSRLEEVNDRLTLITKLKRKYGNSVEEIRTYLAASIEKMNTLQNADNEIESLQDSLKTLKEKNDKLCAQLTKQRKDASVKLAKAVIKQLRALNMPKVEFFCEITPQQRNQNGDDRIEFFLSPNVGEKQIPIKECASGGELSRVMLALQALLAGKEKTPTLIFDEIDANIGGETATVVGEQLIEIGKQHQVLCITHFPQVAKKADHHIQISKQEIAGRTLTIVKALDKTTREKELARMLGNNAVLVES